MPAPALSTKFVRRNMPSRDISTVPAFGSMSIPAPGVVQISLIPFTLQHTTLGERQAGDRVHLEADTIGKYVAQLLRARGDLGAS